MWLGIWVQQNTNVWGCILRKYNVTEKQEVLSWLFDHVRARWVGRVKCEGNKKACISSRLETITLMLSLVLPARDANETDGRTVTSFWNWNKLLHKPHTGISRMPSHGTPRTVSQYMAASEFSSVQQAISNRSSPSMCDWTSSTLVI